MAAVLRANARADGHRSLHQAQVTPSRPASRGTPPIPPSRTTAKLETVELKVASLFGRSAGDGEPLAAIAEERAGTRRADPEPLLAMAERLPRVRLLLLGREPARLRQRRTRRRKAQASATTGWPSDRDPKQLRARTTGKTRASSATKTCSATGRVSCASSSAARITTERCCERRSYPKLRHRRAPPRTWSRRASGSHLLVPDGSRLYDIDARDRRRARRARRGRRQRRDRPTLLDRLGLEAPPLRRRRAAARAARCGRCRWPSRRSATSAAPIAMRSRAASAGAANDMMPDATALARGRPALRRRRRRRARSISPSSAASRLLNRPVIHAATGARRWPSRPTAAATVTFSITTNGTLLTARAMPTSSRRMASR